jgi:hypothetical protein
MKVSITEFARIYYDIFDLNFSEYGKPLFFSLVASILTCCVAFLLKIVQNEYQVGLAITVLISYVLSLVLGVAISNFKDKLVVEKYNAKMHLFNQRKKRSPFECRMHYLGKLIKDDATLCDSLINDYELALNTPMGNSKIIKLGSLLVGVGARDRVVAFISIFFSILGAAIVIGVGSFSDLIEIAVSYRKDFIDFFLMSIVFYTLAAIVYIFVGGFFSFLYVRLILAKKEHSKTTIGFILADLRVYKATELRRIKQI